MDHSLPQFLVWSLIHSMWMGATLWLLTKLLEFVGLSAKRMGGVRLLTLILFTISVLTVLASKLASASSETIAPPAFQITYNTPELPLVKWVEYLINANSLFISWIWMGGVLIGLINYSFGFYNLQSSRRSSYICNDPRIINPLKKIISELNIKVVVQVRFSALINSPATVGWIRPIIYLPISLATGLSDDEIHTILYHELVHIKRHDYLINLALIGIETLFFFNPFVRLMIRAYRNEMEFACDAEVITMNDRRTYINALVKLQELRLPHHFGLAAKNNNSEFKTRINKMMNNNTSNSFRPHKLIPGLLICLLITAVFSSAFISAESISFPLNESSELLLAQDTAKAEKELELERQHRKLKEVEMKQSSEQKETLEKEREAMHRQKEALEKEKQALAQQRQVIRPVNESLKKAAKMMDEIQQELIKDGILSKKQKKVKLMFQYSDLLNGKEVLGDKYEKYKKIFNEYFPRYDSYATTKVFNYE